MKIWSRNEIMARFHPERARRAIERGFIAYSSRAAAVPPIQNFQFDSANGDCCVKSAHVKGVDTFAIKVATGFYDNPKRGLPSNNGLILLFSTLTGEPVALLQDEGWLTAVRTALAGQIVAQLLAPRRVEAIGILGTGVQARLQLEFLLPVTACRKVYVWGRNGIDCDRFKDEMSQFGFDVEPTKSPRILASNANLIVTATPSRSALLDADWIRPGTHITAVGADAPGKQELDPQIFARAGTVVVDSVDQCSKYGEASYALKAGLIRSESLLELGCLLQSANRVRDDDPGLITVADLTGLAVQDAAIANAIIAEPCFEGSH